MARSIWSGAISFGLVNIPVMLYTAVRSREIRFHMLHAKDGSRVRQMLVCPVEGDKEISRDETVRGFEVAPDQYVTVEDKELEAVAPEESRAITILDFVDQSQIDPIYYDRPYYLMPEETAVKPYKLLLEAMTQARKVAIAKFVMREKEYLGALRPAGGMMILTTMRFAQEVVEPSTIGALPANVTAGGKELAMAQQLIAAMTHKFKPDKYHDDYTQRVEDMLRKKAQGERITVAPQAKRPAQLINLQRALEESIALAGGASKKPVATKTKGVAKKPQRKTTAKKRKAA